MKLLCERVCLSITQPHSQSLIQSVNRSRALFCLSYIIKKRLMNFFFSYRCILVCILSYNSSIYLFTEIFCVMLKIFFLFLSVFFGLFFVCSSLPLFVKYFAPTDSLSLILSQIYALYYKGKMIFLHVIFKKCPFF